MSDKTEWYLNPDQLLGALRERNTRDDDRPLTPQIPGYEGFNELSRGGQGVVYSAVQRSTKRKVAIKVLLGGAWAAQERRRRFEREIDLIATLRHPNIVNLYDSGVTADGYPFFVMDYIEGMGLDEAIGVAADVYLGPDADCLDARAPASRAARAPLMALRPTLDLIAKIADAIHYAHQRGVIHRDLKPSNIRLDADVRPHLLDFGLAKAADDPSTGMHQVGVSETGAFMGSLPWASPEQVAGLPDEVDLRTDIYSLGVILYQMLVGQFPYRVSGPFSDVLENIRRAVPPKPSTFHAQINDEVDTIVLKCLAKEPERRYQTAGELARDLKHYLAGEPIEAKRDSAIYNLRKAMRRYRFAMRVGAGAVVFMLLASFWLSLLWLRAVQAEQSAAEQGANLARLSESERAARLRAEREALQAQAIAEFLENMLAKPVDLGREARVADVLDEAVAGLEAATDLSSEVEARLRLTIGASYATLGMYAEAEPQIERAVELRRRDPGEQHPDFAAALNALGQLRDDQGRLAEAEAAHRRALSIRRATLEPGDPAIAASLNNLAAVLRAAGRLDEARERYEAALALNRAAYGDEHPTIAIGLNNLAIVLKEQGDLAEAGRLHRAALALRRKLFGDEHPSIAIDLNNLAALLDEQGKYAESEVLYREALAMQRKFHGDQHQSVADVLHNLGVCRLNQGDVAEARRLLHAGLAMRQNLFGAAHPDVATSLHSLGVVAYALGEYDEAERDLRAALEMRRDLLGNRHPALIATLQNLGALLLDKQDYAGAKAAYAEAAEISRAVFSATNPLVATAAARLAAVYQVTGDLAKAETQRRAALQTWRVARGDDAVETLESEYELASLLNLRGRFDEALPLARAAYDGLRGQVGERDPRTLHALNNLAISLRQQDGLSEAIALYRGALQRMNIEPGDEDAETTGLLLNVGAMLLELGDPAALVEADVWLHQAYAARLRLYGPDHAETVFARLQLAILALDRGETTDAAAALGALVDEARAAWPPGHFMPYVVQGLYGQALFELDEFAAATTEVQEALTGLEATLGETHWRVAAVLERLISIRRAAGDQKEVERLQARLDQLRQSTAAAAVGEAAQTQPSFPP